MRNVLLLSLGGAALYFVLRRFGFIGATSSTTRAQEYLRSGPEDRVPYAGLTPGSGKGL